MEIKTKFELKDDIYIESLKVRGRIMAVFLDNLDIQYRVRFFDKELNNKTEYFFEDELERYKNQDKEKIGFS